MENFLEKNVDLSKDEYKEMCERADKTSEAQGFAGEEIPDEQTRHQRIASNFYGTAVNVMFAMYELLTAINSNLEEVKKAIGIMEDDK